YLDDEKPDKLPKDEYFQKDLAFKAKDFAPGGKLFGKRIAVLGHYEKDSIYQVAVINGVAKKVRVLYNGKIEDGKFADCDYAQGIYEIACAEPCGMGHCTMRAFLHVEPLVVYENWLKSEMEDVSEPPPAWKFWRD